MSFPLPGLDAYLTPPDGPRPAGNYQPQPCEGYIENRRLQSADLDSDLRRILELVRPIDGVPVTGTTLERVARLVGAVISENSDMPSAEEVECGYDGRVDADYAAAGRAAGTYYWTCPRCGTNREEFREAGDDA
jgi:hypothetical protein